MEDNKIVDHIKDLVHEEERLYSKNTLNDAEIASLKKMKVELDQCWDYLRQRQALRSAGKNPDSAKPRPSDTVENYEQ